MQLSPSQLVNLRSPPSRVLRGEFLHSRHNGVAMAFLKFIVAAMAALSLVQSVRLDEDEENGCILYGKCCTVKCNGHWGFCSECCELKRTEPYFPEQSDV